MNRSKSLLFLAFAALTTCGRESLEPVPGTVETIVVSPAVSVVSVGAQLELSAQVLDVSGTAVGDRPVHWASADVDVATVTSDGVVTARKVGTVQVAASTGGRSGMAQITVTTVPVASVHIAPGNKSLVVGETFQFAADARDAGGNLLTGRPIVWASNNESVATVSSTGLVTATSPGGAIITATSEGRSAPASITVSAVPIASIQVKPNSQTLVAGQTAQLQAQPLDATGDPLVGRTILWFTNNASVATVTSAGLVTAHNPGNATITATSEGQNGSASIRVTLPVPNAVVVAPAQVLVEEGKTSQLTVQVLDSQGSELPNSVVTYASSDATVATVSGSGVVTGVTPGKATITASSGGKSGTADVTVTPTPVANVVVSPAQPYVIIGKTITLTAQASSATGQVLSGRTVTWSSGTPSVAEVSSSGVVTALSVGSSVIFASIDGVLGWATVTVLPVPVAGVIVSPATSAVAIGQTTQLSVTLFDASGNTLSGRVVSWSSSQPGIATVNGGGLVSGVSAGTATITAMSEGQMGSATVNVAAPGVRTVTVQPSSATIAPFGTVTLTAVVRDPSGAIINASVSWTSSNSLVAGVSSSGTVTGYLPGTVTITAKAGSATGTATITVK